MSLKSGTGKLRLPNYDYSVANAYFITTNLRWDSIKLGHVIKGKKHPNENGVIVSRCWHDLVNHYQWIVLDAFVVMPNHIHGIIFLMEPSREDKGPSLATVVGSFKSYSARRINERLKRAGNPVWQTSFYDRVIRDEVELDKFRNYIMTNPLRWSLKRDDLS